MNGTPVVAKRRQSDRGTENDIVLALRRHRSVFFAVGLFSGIVNLLALTGSMYMLQVYDRVLSSQSVPTLIGLTVLMAGLYLIYGLLDFFRLRLMSRVGLRVDSELTDKVYALVQLLPLRSRLGGDGLQPVRDLDTIRGFLSGLGPTAIFDLPWIPLYLGVVFLLHPMLGTFAVAAAILLVSLTLWTEIASAGPTRRAAKSYRDRTELGEATRRNAQAIRALGMGEHLSRRWRTLNASYVGDQVSATDATTGIGSLSKISRLVLQSGILGLGAYLVLLGEMTAGAIIAASITMSRALAPIELAIAHWRGFVAARQSYRRLVELFNSVDRDNRQRLALPPPCRSLNVSSLFVSPPGASKQVISNVSFSLQAGDGLGIVGPTASGKSTLARALVGIWAASHPVSAIRLDGASLDQWPPETLGRYIGYLPQDVELLSGTIAENISRFDPDATSEAIIAAAQAAFCHDLIVSFQDGYETQIGDDGSALSGGLRQRIGLARALYGNPFLVVLDEPNANLDGAGDSALTQAILALRRRGAIVIVIAHRKSAIAGLNKMMSLANGHVQEFGPKEEVLAKLLGASQPPSQPVEASQIVAAPSAAPTPPNREPQTRPTMTASRPSTVVTMKKPQEASPSQSQAASLQRRTSFTTRVEDVPGVVILPIAGPREGEQNGESEK